MTAKAYVLIETQVGKTKQVVEAIGRLQGDEGKRVAALIHITC
jgi:hypothetical protein